MDIYERLCFTVEWFQVEAGLTHNYTFIYFPNDNSVEMFDRKKNKIFMKRVKVPEISEKHLYLGAKLNLFGRQVVITAYEDDYTKHKMTNQRQKAFGLIPAKFLSKLGDILKVICDNGFFISNCAMFTMTKLQSDELTQMLGFGISDIWCAGPCVALVLTGSDALHRLKQLITGPERIASKTKSDDLKFGSGAMTDAVFCPNSAKDLPKAIDLFFSSRSDENQIKLVRCMNQNSTLCLIKPHAMLDGKCGDILMAIAEHGFVIKAMKMFNLRRQNCEEFYEVYNGVSADYLQMVTELSSGPFLAIEIGCCNPCQSAYQSFRQLCGPFDPEIARQIRPKTIRAQFGENTAKNAVHCTDLEEDCLNEIEYYFNILSQ